MFHIQSILGTPGNLNLVGTLYQQSLFFADSALLMGFKLGEQVFDDTGVDPVVGRGGPYGQIVLGDIHERKIEMRSRHDNKAGG